MRFFGKKNAIEKIKTQNVSEITNADANVIHNHDDKNKLSSHKEEKVLVAQQKESDPDDYEGWHNKAVSLSKSSMYEEANESYDKALEMNPQSEVTLNNKAINLVKWGESFLRQPNGIEQFNKRLEESLEPFSKALQINPNNAIAWNDKGRALFLLNRRPEALECFDKGLAIDPKNIALLSNKGCELSLQNRNDEAITCFAEILNIDPGNVKAKDWLRSLKKRQNKK
jgi:tetratricopeptide (TPR) repeat protein